MASPARVVADRLAGSVTGVQRLPHSLVLTYDDGPEPGSTEQVLAALREAGATATFFILVNRARVWPALLREVRDAGHDIALHGPDHVRITTLPVGVVARRTRDAKRELEDLAQVPVKWFRPPYGKQRLADLASAKALGLDVVMWGPTFLDWVPATDEQRLASATDGVRAGAVVLAHDGYATLQERADDGPDPLIDRQALTGSVLAEYRTLGLRAVSLSRALERGGRPQRSWWIRG